MKRDPETMAARYTAGLTLRQIGAEIGRSHQAVRYQLLKLKDYRAMVTRMLLKRIRDAERAFAITRTRDNRRRLKHSLAMLRQKRPATFVRLIYRTRPKRCKGCGTKIDARPVAGLWSWRCGYCGESDFVLIRPSAKRKKRAHAMRRGL